MSSPASSIRVEGDVASSLLPARTFHDTGPGGLAIGRSSLTKYEITRVYGVRLEQLSRGGIPLVPFTSALRTIEDVVREELRQKKLPYLIERPFPTGTRTYRLRYMNYDNVTYDPNGM